MVLKFSTNQPLAYTPSVPVSTRLLLHGQNLNDYSGKNNSVSGSASNFGNPFDFGGSFGGNLQVASSASLDLSGSDFTIDFWFNQDADMGSGRYAYFHIGDGTEAITMYVDNKRLYCFVISGGASVVTVSEDSTIGDWSPAAGWHHLALVRSGSDYIIYYDGTARNTVTDTDGIAAGNRPAYFGEHPVYAYSYTGDLAEIRVISDGNWSGVPQAPYRLQYLTTIANLEQTIPLVQNLSGGVDTPPEWGTSVAAPTFTDNDLVVPGFTYRQFIPSSAITKSGTSIRLTVHGGVGVLDEIQYGQVWIGHQGTNPWEFDGNQVRVLYLGGDPGIVFPDDSLTSDDTLFDIDETKNLVVAYEVPFALLFQAERPIEYATGWQDYVQSSGTVSDSTPSVTSNINGRVCVGEIQAYG